MQVRKADNTSSLGFDARSQPIGVGIGELRLDGLSYLPLGLSDDSRDLGCGSGPDVRIGAETYRTAVVASPAQLHRGDLVAGLLCRGTATVGAVPLTQGDNDVTSSSTGRPLALERPGAQCGNLASAVRRR